MGEPVLDGQVTFKAETTYWSMRQKHSIQSSYMRGIGRRRWNLEGGEGVVAKDFEVKRESSCNYTSTNWGNWAADPRTGVPPFMRRQMEQQLKTMVEPYGCGFDHIVSEKLVYAYCTEVLKMTPVKPNVVEVLVEVEKIIEVPWQMTAEQRELLSFALTRERIVTEEELREAYEFEDVAMVKAVSGRLATIREMFEYLKLPVAKGRPTWLLERKPVTEPEQQELFDAV